MRIANRLWLIAGLATAMSATVAVANENAPEVRSTQPRLVEAEYEARWRDLPVFAARLTLDVSLETYRVRIESRTAGLGAIVVPAVFEWRTAGRIVNGRFLPLTFVSRREWPDGQQRVELTFDQDGRIVTQHHPPVFGADTPRVPEEMQRNSFDPLTALINAATRGDGEEPCAIEANVYDGDRRQDIALEQLDYQFSPVGYRGGAYGQVYHCVVNVTENPASTGNEDGIDLHPQAIWVIRVPEVAVWLPVALVFEGRFGRLEVALKDMNVEDRRLN